MAGSNSAKMAAYTQLDLRQRRVKKGLSLEQIADSTKISIRFLRAIEAEELEKLPGGIFTTSYLKQYALAISFDPATLLSVYEQQNEPAQAPDATIGASSRGGFLRWLRVATLEDR